MCLVTGGASGIGAATAGRFTEEGATVVTIDLQAGDGDLAITADVADEADLFLAADESRFARRSSHAHTCMR